MENGTKLEINDNLAHLEYYCWGGKPEVTLYYKERSSSHWHADSETDVNIDREKALEVVKFLTEAYNIGSIPAPEHKPDEYYES